MPDLSTEAVHQFWNQYEDRMIYKVISFMEGVETWTVDSDPEFEAAIAELGKQLDDISTIDLAELAEQEAFIRTANGLHSGRALRLLQIIDIAHPGSASKLLIHAEEVSKNPQDAPGLFLRRNIVFERLRLLSRVFSPERFALVLKAIEGEERA
jgi:intracellular multiplication protein IcmW